MRFEGGKLFPGNREQALSCEFALDPNKDTQIMSTDSWGSRATNRWGGGYSVSGTALVIERLRDTILDALPPEDKDGYNNPKSLRQCVKVLALIAQAGHQTSIQQAGQAEVISAVIQQVGTRIDAAVTLPSPQPSLTPGE